VVDLQTVLSGQTYDKKMHAPIFCLLRRFACTKRYCDKAFDCTAVQLHFYKKTTGLPIGSTYFFKCQNHF
jgi:hypothetical protein